MSSSVHWFRPFMKKQDLEEVDDNKQVQKEGSWASSYVNDEKSGIIRVKNDTSSSSAMFDLKGRPKVYGKGFVPYKRCIAERENESSSKEEREEQRIRLSL